MQLALEGDETYMANLVHSMSLTLEEFYKELKVTVFSCCYVICYSWLLQAVGVSAVTGAGMDDLFAAIHSAAQDYHKYVHYHCCILSLMMMYIGFIRKI